MNAPRYHPQPPHRHLQGADREADLRMRLWAMEGELLELRRQNGALKRQLEELRRDLLACAERVHAQSELLSRKAERKEA